AVCSAWPAAVALRSKSVREAWVLLGVHATHHVVIHRYPRADDRLLTRAQIVEVRPSRAGTLVVARLHTVTQSGRPVTATDYGSVYRGISTEAEARAPVDPLPWSERPGSDQTRWTATVPVAARAAHVYSECARIWNPIHTDIAVARMAGLAADPPRLRDARAGGVAGGPAGSRRRSHARDRDRRALHRDGVHAVELRRARARARGPRG